VNRRDSGVAFALVAVLGILAGAIAMPAFRPAAVPAPIPTAAPSLGHVQGVLGRPSSITPLTARTQVDRDLVALLFRGLVRLGPGNAILPDLAERWTVTEKGARWTFHLRADATWHDGVPVTSRDVVYTVDVLHDPDYTGPLASTWAEIQATALDERTVQFDLADPVGGFLQAAVLPLLPAHILSGVPVASLADDPYAREPLGNGAFALVEMAADRAVLEPVLPQVRSAVAPLEDPGTGEIATRIPRLPRLELRFYDTAEELTAAFVAGAVTSVGDLPPAAAMALATAMPEARAIRYPATTLTALAFNLRGLGGPFADARTRRALVAAINRADLVTDLLGGAGARADTPIPPSSWAYDAKAAPEIAYDRGAASKGLREAGWRRVDKAWIPPRASKPLAVAILAPEAAANVIAHDAATRVAAAGARGAAAGRRLHGRRHRRQHGPGSGPVSHPGVQPVPGGRREHLRDPGRRTGQGPRGGAGSGRGGGANEGLRCPPEAVGDPPADAHPLLPRHRVRGGPGPRRPRLAAPRRSRRSLLGRGTLDHRRAVTLSARSR
jgi:ABC-type transport system substrate-binding protein